MATAQPLLRILAPTAESHFQHVTLWVTLCVYVFLPSHEPSTSRTLSVSPLSLLLVPAIGCAQSARLRLVDP